MFDIHDFAAALRRWRKERGLTQNELARELMVTPQSVSRWECGESLPDVSRLCELAGLLGVSLDVLLNSRSEGSRTLIGIDAGGTKSEFVMIDEEGRRLNGVTLEGSTPSIKGMDHVISVVRRGIDLMRPTEMNTAAIFFGGADMEDGSNADVLRTALQRAYPGVVVDCASDIFNVIACCSRPERCIAVISGTGCVAWSSMDGEVRRVGGTGYLFEEEGSGFDIGRQAVTAVLRSYDGIGPATVLTELLEARLGYSAQGRLQDFYEAGVSYIASFAPLVTQAARQGDPTAREILQRNAAYLRRLIAVARRNAPAARHVILSGGMLIRDELFCSMVTEGLEPELTVEKVTYAPVWGACLQAAKLCGMENTLKLENFLEKQG